MDNENPYFERPGGFGVVEPEDRKRAREAEEAKIKNELPKVEAMIKHLEKRIAFRDSIKAIAVDIAESPELHQKACAVNEAIAEALREEKQLLEDALSNIK